MPTFVMRYQDASGRWEEREIAGCDTRKEADKQANAFFNAHDLRELLLVRRLRSWQSQGEVIGHWIVLLDEEG